MNWVFHSFLNCCKCGMTQRKCNDFGYCAKCWIKLTPEQRLILHPGREIEYRTLYKTTIASNVDTVLMTILAIEIIVDLVIILMPSHGR